MQERVHLVRGKFSVESQPGKGTSVLAVVPIAAESGESSKDLPLKETASVTEIA